MNNVIFTFRKIDNSTSSITGISSSDVQVLEIPEKDDDGLLITKIDSRAFKGNKTIEKVIIPDSISDIGESAFENCSNLRTLVLPKVMNEIGDHAFKRCDIDSLILPELRNIGFAAFSKNKNGNFTITRKIGYVKSHAFNECKILKCLLTNADMKKWDKEWSVGIQNIVNEKEDVQIIKENLNTIVDNQNNNILNNEKVNNEKNKLELLDNNIVTDYKDGVVYAKSVRLSFSIKRLFISKIPVFQSEQLSFYQKFIILLLSKGVKANDLTESLSSILNVSKICVDDFLRYLNNNYYLEYDKKTDLYKLCKDVHFTLEPKFDNAMFAELTTKLADCNQIIYLKEIDKCYLEKDFNNGVFKRKSNIVYDDVGYSESYEIGSSNFSKSEIYDLLVKYYEQTNIHIKKDFSFDVKLSKSYEYQLEFDALLQYNYSKENSKATLFNTIVLKDNFLPTRLIELLTEKYKVDNDLPRFLSMKEQFYDNVEQSTLELEQTDLSIEKAKLDCMPLNEEVEKSVSELKELRKTNRIKKKEASNAVEEIISQLKIKEEDISLNEALINKPPINDEKLIQNLKKTIMDLKESQKKLNEELTVKTNYVQKLETDLQKSEDNLSKIVKENKKALRNAQSVIEKYEQEKKEQDCALTSLLTNNKNKTNKTIKSVIQKYPLDKNIFYRYINNIVVSLDSAISASESNAVDEVAMCIDKIREMYRKVIQVVFDKLLNKNEMNLGSYMTDFYNQLEVEKMFEARGINIDVKQRLVMFHELANAIGHLAENGPKKEANLRRLNEFKTMSLFERNRLILAIPDFFNSISFTPNEVEVFVKRLTIK